MEERTKQRLVGVLVFVGAVFIILPFLFHNSKPGDRDVAQAVDNKTVVAMNGNNDQQAANTDVPAEVAAQQAATVPPAQTNTDPALVTGPGPAMPPAPSAPAAVDPGVSQPQPQAPTTPTPAPAPMPSMPAPTNPSPAAPVVDQPAQASQPQEPAPMPEAAPVDNTDAQQPVDTQSVSEAKPVLKKTAANAVKQGWVIQVGAFSEKTNAKRLVAKLQTRHLPVYTHTAHQNGRVLTYVFVGPEHNLQHARLSQQQLRSTLNLSGEIKRA